MEWLDDNRIKTTPPRKPKKLTATRFATVLGLNPWSTPFEVWCNISRVYEEPYTDTVYTIAGKTIEPKQIDYMKRAYFMTNLVTPTDLYGKDYFKKTYGDFYHDEPVFGGMWDSLLYDNDKPSAVLEFKTTKRVEDWLGKIPEYYALQASLYAYLLGVDRVIMVASFLEPKDYEKPELYKCSSENTITSEFSLKDRYPNFEQAYVKPAEAWWKRHVETGVSPEYDEVKDADILKNLRRSHIEPEKELSEYIREADRLQTELDMNKANIADTEKRLKTVKDIIKKECQQQFRDGDTAVSVSGTFYEWTTQKTLKKDVDKKKLEKDGLLDRYLKESTVYKLTAKKIPHSPTAE